MRIKIQYETETYISAGGYFCIAQDQVDGEDTQVVMLSRYQCQLLANELAKMAKRADWWADVSADPEEI